MVVVDSGGTGGTIQGRGDQNTMKKPWKWKSKKEAIWKSNGDREAVKIGKQ